MEPQGDMEVVVRALEFVAHGIEANPDRREEGIAFADVELAAQEIDLELDDDEQEELEVTLSDWASESEALGVKTLIHTDKEPRGGMLTYQQTLGRITLPSSRRIYVGWGDLEPLRALAVAPAGSRDASDLRVVQLAGPGMVDLPFSCAGDLLFRIDVLWTAASHRDFVLDALTDWEADWMTQELIETAEDDGAESDEPDADAAPPWFRSLADSTLRSVADLPMPAADRDPPLVHVFVPWERPTTVMFRELPDPRALQHICAAWVVGDFGPELDEC